MGGNSDRKTTLPMREPTETCNAVNRSGGYCSLQAGFGTDHVGTGRCKFHGGASPGGPIKHGLYSKSYTLSLAEKTEELRQHPELFHLSAELLSLKGLLGHIYGSLPESPSDWLTEENQPKIRLLIQLSAEIRKTFKAIIEMQVKVGAFLTMSDVTSMMRQLAFIVDDVCGSCAKRTVLQDRILSDLRFTSTGGEGIIDAQFEDVSGQTADAEKRELQRARRRTKDRRAREKKRAARRDREAELSRFGEED